jgi:hypothetical protein
MAERSVDSDTQSIGVALTQRNAEEPDKADMPLALKLATRVYALQGNEGWQYENILARAHAANKAYDKAVEFETKAIAGAPKQVKPQLEKILEEYKKKAEPK